MIKFFGRLIFSYFLNFLALLAAAYFIAGFELSADYYQVLFLTGIFTLIHVFIKPVLKLILTPLIIITFGLGIIAINAAILYFLDFYSEIINITGLIPLFYATIIISLINLIAGFSAKRLYQD